MHVTGKGTISKPRGKKCSRKEHVRRAGPCQHRHNFHFPTLGPRYMYICSRCLGIYGGFLVWSLLFVVLRPVVHFLQELDPVLTLLLCWFLTTPLTADWLLQCKGLHHSNNPTRLLTGLFLSLAGVTAVVAYPAVWLTAPIGFLWFLLVSRVGTRWRATRPKTWGCIYCRNLLPEAYPIKEAIVY